VALLGAHPAHILQLSLKLQQPALDLAPVSLQLGFARAPAPDAAAQLGHGSPPSSEPGQHVLQLRQLYLKLAFTGARVAGKNVQDQLRTIDHTDGQRAFKIPQLGRGEVMIEEDQRGLGRLRHGGDLFHFALAHKRCGVWSRPALEYFGNHFLPSTGYQLAKFCESRPAVRSGMLLVGGMACGAAKPGCFPRQGSGARQCFRPGGELHPDQQRTICLNARVFQKTLIGEA
jgi:hypothetical protein